MGPAQFCARGPSWILCANEEERSDDNMLCVYLLLKLLLHCPTGLTWKMQFKGKNIENLRRVTGER